MSTGAIWTRWCLIIKPRNMFLATVNFFLFLVGSVQVSRVLLYRRSLEGNNAAETAKQTVKDGAEKVENVVKDSADAVANAVSRQ